MDSTARNRIGVVVTVLACVLGPRALAAQTLALGDSVVGEISVSGEADIFDIVLVPDDTVDIAVFPTDGSTLNVVGVRVLGAAGDTLESGVWRHPPSGATGQLIGSSTVTPDTLITSADLILSADATGLSAGVHRGTLTLTSADADNSPLTVSVELTVLGTGIALGDTVVATLAPAAVDSFFLTLAVDDTVDIGVWPAGATPGGELENPRLRVYDPNGAELADIGQTLPNPDPVLCCTVALDAGRVASIAGTYRIEVSEENDGGGAYLLKVRRSGAILDYDQTFFRIPVPEGGAPASDTVWIFNPGARAAEWTAVTTGEPWLTVSPTAGTLPPSGPAPSSLRAAGPIPSPQGIPGARAAAPHQDSELMVFTSPSLAPAGSVPITLTVDPGGFPTSWTDAGLVLSLPSDPWGGQASMTVRMQVYDSRISILASKVSPYLWAIETHEDGRLVTGVSRTDTTSNLEYVDSITGQQTLWLQDIASRWTPSGLAFGPDSTLWMADDPGLFTVLPDGTVTEVGDLHPGDVDVAPDGTVYVSDNAGAGIVRIDPDGTMTTIWDDMDHIAPLGIAYYPPDGMIYFGGRGRMLHRLDPNTGAVEWLADVGALIYSLEVGASGYLYAGTWPNPNITVLTPEGYVVEKVQGPAPGAGITLTCGAIFGTTYRYPNVIYRFPVDDCPMDASATNLVSEHHEPETMPSGRVISGDVVVDTDDGTVLTVTVSWNSAWLSATPTSGPTPFTFTGTIDATGLAPGTYTDTLYYTAPGAANSPLKRPITITVPTGMAVGDSVVVHDAYPHHGSHQHFLNLAAGDVVDIAVFDVPDDGSAPTMDLYAPDGTLMASGSDRYSAGAYVGEVIASFHADVAGTYEIEVNFLFEVGPGSYVLKSRLAGPVVVTEPSFFGLIAPGGGTPVSDTLWLYNPGPDPLSWELSSTLPSWVTVSTTSGPLAAVDRAPDRARQPEAAESGSAPSGLTSASQAGAPLLAVPAGATPVVVTLDPAGLSPGSEIETLITFSPVGDQWAADAHSEVSISAHDPAYTTLARVPPEVHDVLVYSPTELVVSKERGLWKINRSTGEASPWAEDLDPGADLWLLGLEHAGGGSIYVADLSGRFYLVEPDGTASVVMDVGEQGFDPVVLPDGTLIAAAGPGFYRLARDGSVVLLAADRDSKRSVYNPLDGWIYYATFGDGVAPRELKRVHPTSGTIETVAPLGGILMDLQIGASGKIYANSSGGLIMLDSSGAVLGEVLSGSTGLGVALGDVGEDVLYLTSRFIPPRDAILKMTVDDHRAEMPDAPTATAWIDDATVFPGDTVTIPVRVDIAGTGKAIGSVDAKVTWDPAKATFLSISQADFNGVFESNTTAAADSGWVTFGGVNASDTANVDTTAVAGLTLVIDAMGGEQVLMDLMIMGLTATDAADLTLGLAVRSGLFRVATGTWGDPSNEGVITALDALMCLTHVVARPLPEGTDVGACDVAPDLDLDEDGIAETFDGTVTSLDALAILTHVVGRALPTTYRLGQPR